MGKGLVIQECVFSAANASPFSVSSSTYFHIDTDSDGHHCVLTKPILEVQHRG